MIVLGFFVSKYASTKFPFFNPITLCVLGTFEVVVLFSSGNALYREESKLVAELLELLRPWRDDYGIVAKVRKTRGRSRTNNTGRSGRSNNDKDNSSLYYCIVLEKITPGIDVDTVSLSSLTDIESVADDKNPVNS